MDRRGGCFRIPRRAVGRSRSEDRRLKKAFSSDSQRNIGPSPGSRHALHVHQYADQTGVYLASVK